MLFKKVIAIDEVIYVTKKNKSTAITDNRIMGKCSYTELYCMKSRENICVKKYELTNSTTFHICL